MRKPIEVSRREFLKGSIGAAAAFTIVPRRVLGGPGNTPPSEIFGGALIGCGGRGNGTFNGLGPNVEKRAICDIKFVGKTGDKMIYTDFRRVLERKDIDVVAIATPPHWHALISIAAMEAGKDVLCEKPMTRFIAEGRAVADAEKRYKRIFQVGTYGRFGDSQNRGRIDSHKIMESGLLKNCEGVHIKPGGLKVKQWSGMVNATPQPIPKSLDWDIHNAMTYFTMYSYNFCWLVRTLRIQDRNDRWLSRTPAMVAGLTDHIWSLHEWLTYPAVQLT